MKKLLLLIAAIIVVVVLSSNLNKAPAENSENTSEENPETIPVKVIPISHATAILEWGDVVIYTDPVGGAAAFEGKPQPDIVLVTDVHTDHLSTSTLTAIVGSSTLIVPQAVKDSLPPSLATSSIVLVNKGNVIEQDILITAMPMYNLPESDDSRHVKGRGNGYILERDDFRVYIAGDTAGIPEMLALTDIDMAFIPMNLPFTMSVEEAASAVLEFKPKRVYPYHYRGQNGLSDVNKFKELVNAGNSDIEVILLDWYPKQ